MYGRVKRGARRSNEQPRREQRRRSSAKKRTMRLAALSENIGSFEPPTQSVPVIGTAANCAPLPFNRMNLPPPASNSNTWESGFEIPVYQDWGTTGQMNSFMPVPHTPSMGFHNQENYYFTRACPGKSIAPNDAYIYDLEEGEIPVL